MKNTKVTLVPLTADDREQFILDNQWAFKYGAMMEFGERDDHLDGNGEIISRATIEKSIDNPQSETYRIMLDGEKVGGLILTIDKETHHNHLDILFVLPNFFIQHPMARSVMNTRTIIADLAAFSGQIGANLIRHRRLCTVVP